MKNHRSIHRLALSAAGVALALGVFAGGAPATTSAPPQNTSRPTITGTAQVGRTLTGHNGGWIGTQPIRYDFQWLRCDSNGGSCAEIGGARNQRYVVASADAGRRLRVRVTAHNGDGAQAARSDPTAVVRNAPAEAPRNTAPPTIQGSPVEASTLTATPGAWTGTAPMSLRYQWQRCDSNGGSCAAIAGATSTTYRVTNADVGLRLRVAVTARNSAGARTAASVPTAVVQPAGPEGQIRLPNGKVSIPINAVAPPQRLVIDGVKFTPNPVRSRTAPLVVRVHVSDTRGFVVRGALVFVRSTPLLTTTPPEQLTDVDGWVPLQMRPRLDFPLKRGFSVQFFVRARKQGDNLLAGVSARRLVQVRTAPPR